jgi:hypothetical protein
MKAAFSAHGNVAIARYLDTYDDVYHGQHRSRSVICTDTWANERGNLWQPTARRKNRTGCLR